LNDGVTMETRGNEAGFIIYTLVWGLSPQTSKR
jgi:hypothetical protein